MNTDSKTAMFPISVAQLHFIFCVTTHCEAMICCVPFEKFANLVDWYMGSGNKHSEIGNTQHCCQEVLNLGCKAVYNKQKEQ